MRCRLIAPVVDLECLRWFGRRPPPTAAVAAVRESLKSASVWRIKNHGCPENKISALRAAGTRFFDQPAAQKLAYAVGTMDRSRGWELYPQHWRFHRATLASANSHATHPELSATEGILCERFVCGPPSICSDSHLRRSEPFYDSPFGRVFYERNTWPHPEAPGGQLQPTMEAAYDALTPIAAASLQCLAAACGLAHDAFDELIATSSAAHPHAPLRHHSRLQLNNYPSQLRDHRCKRLPPIRASRHLDTSREEVTIPAY